MVRQSTAAARQAVRPALHMCMSTGRQAGMHWQLWGEGGVRLL